MNKAIPEQDRALAKLAKALGHEGRTFLIRLLVMHDEQSVTQLTNRSGMSQPEVSRHLKTLLAVELVQVEQQGRVRMYRANRVVLRRASGLMGALAMYAR